MLVFNPAIFIQKSIIFLAILFGVFVTGVGVGFLTGLIVAHTGLGDAIVDIIYSIQALLNDQFE